MQLIFKGSTPQAGTARTFIFTAPNLPTWTAGQSIKIDMPGPYGPIDHRFTIASAPSEQVIAITTRPSDSAYKQSLWRLQPGDQVNAYAIEGDVVWCQNRQPHLFVAAGIGITPFRSMLAERVHHGQPLAATLFYKSHADIIYKEELDTWQASHPELTVSYITNRPLGWQEIAEAGKGLIYLSGPSLMVDDLSGQLIKHGISQDRLIRDWFTGRLPEEA